MPENRSGTCGALYRALLGENATSICFTGQPRLAGGTSAMQAGSTTFLPSSSINVSPQGLGRFITLCPEVLFRINYQQLRWAAS